MAKVEGRVADGVIVGRMQPDRVSIGFRVVDGDPVGIHLAPALAVNLAADLINDATAHAAPSDEAANLSATPIEVTHMAVARGRDAGEALLAMQAGGAILTFAVDLEMLVGTIEAVGRASRPGKPRRR